MSSVPTMIGASSSADGGRTTSVGQAACWETHRLTEPKKQAADAAEATRPDDHGRGLLRRALQRVSWSSSLTTTVTGRSGK